jgi:large subunit ribosomal protein L18
MNKNIKKFLKRKQRTRTVIRKSSNGKPRLSVYRSGQHIYAQIIDDINSKTLAAASTLEKAVAKEIGKSKSNAEAAAVVGRAIAEKAVKLKVSEVVFDRGGYLYHGRVKALAEAARSAGLKF